ncbi:MAG TPA: heparinase II/III family protein [Actinomycetes bacterium]
MSSFGIAVRPTARRWRRRVTAVAAAVAAAVALSAVPSLPAEAAPVRANVAAAAKQCDLGLGAAKGSDRRKARRLMEGQANLREYGYFHLAANPKWRPVATLDSSGRGHMHSLHYLLPLLRYGVTSGDSTMVARFYGLLRDWTRDNPPGGASSRYAWGPPIYEGFRSLVLVCAAAGPRGDAPWLLKALALHGRKMADYRRYEGINNASLHQSMGLYAVGETLRRPAWRDLAIRRMRALAVRLIRPDGSDEEGALQYALNNYRWFGQAAERLRRGGDPVPAELNLIHRVPAFLAQATRPDGRLEALGDTSPRPLDPTTWVGTAAEFPASLGTTGAAPASTFTAYQGGYVFGRSGWGTSRPLADETWFSLRAGKATPHAHDDAGSFTLYAHGSPLLLDTGQWRYLYGTTRSFVVSRAAHNVVVVNGVKRTRLRPELRTTSVGGLDIATVVDRGYRGVTLTRTVAYDRADDVFVVWDRLASAKKVRASQQWGLGRDRGVTLDADAAHTTGPGANVSLLFTSGGAPLDIAVGGRRPMRGWNSQSYGELSPSPSLRATQRGTDLSWLTVISPRAADVPGTSVTATASVSTAAAQVALTAPGGSALVSLDDLGGARTAHSPVPAGVRPGADIVLAGQPTTFRATGLPPGSRASLETLSPDGLTWSPVQTGAVSAAGTAELTVPVSTSADYRVVSAGSASAASRVTAAVPPAPPSGVSAAPAGRGEVTVSWQPPVDTGGAPLTRYRVDVDGTRLTLPPGQTSVVVPGVAPGVQDVWVRAANAVAVSPLTRATVDVPAYPAVNGPTRVRKGTTVSLSLRGLLRRDGVAVTVTVPSTGRVRTLHPTVRRDGTAVLRIEITKRVRVVATSGGVTSAPHRIRPH